MSLINSIAEGGQTWAHKVRMVRQVLKIALFWSLTVGVLSFGYHLYQVPSFFFKAAFYYYKAQGLEIFNDHTYVDREFWYQATREFYSNPSIPIRSTRVSQACKPYYDDLLLQIQKTALASLKNSLLVTGLFISFFILRGKRARRQKLLSGKAVQSATQTAWRLKLTNRASPITLGKLPLVKATETQHILITGGTGSGKTNCLHHILPSIRRQHQKAVIVDTTGTLVARYFNPDQDILLNPLDKRAHLWSPWAECHNRLDFDSMAASFIPTSLHEQENYWRTAARSVVSALLEQNAYTQHTSAFIHALLYQPLTQLCKLLENSKAGAHLDIASERTAGSIRSVAASYLECLETLENTTTPFSIRKWMQQSGSGWLFLLAKPNQRVTMTPLLSAWLSIAMHSLLQLEPDLDRRVWFIMDELPTLQKVKDLEMLICEGRKFGGCALLAMQSPAQLESIYGYETARILTGNCLTRIAFSEQDPEIAERISRSFGKQEITQYQEGISYGAHEMRDGVSLSKQITQRPVVSANDILALEKHEAFVKLPGNLPIIRLRLPLVN